jgi:LAO/AO transport system kinase
MLSTSEYIKGILNGDRAILSRAITLIESKKEDHRAQANEIISACMEQRTESKRIGITGVPGVGKSTFIESIGNHLCDRGHRLAVLAVDPSSTRSRGSILGDKTRMEKLGRRQEAYIRPSPSSGSLGGVARNTRESIILCEAAGFDIILVETVGVGQSETAVRDMVDLFVLLMATGTGDELQGIKRGIMEMAELIVFNKADGDNLVKAKRSRAEFERAVHYLPPLDHGQATQVMICSAIENTGIDEIWTAALSFFEKIESSGWKDDNRAAQKIHWMYESLENHLHHHFFNQAENKAMITAMEAKIRSHTYNPYQAAEQIISKWHENG